MKTSSMKFFPILVTTVLIALSSCKDDNSDNSVLIASDEVADIGASSLSENSAGLVLTIENGASVSDKAVAASTGGRIASCGYSKDSTFTKSNAAGSPVTYNYNFQYNYTLACGGPVPQSLTVGMDASGTFDGMRVSSTNSSTATLVVESLDHTFTTYSINGAYTRQGTFQSKVRNMTASSSIVTITLDDVTVDKSTKGIIGGTATLTIAGTVTGKGSFSYSAKVTFNGNGQATMVINGVTYNVNLLTGDVG